MSVPLGCDVPAAPTSARRSSARSTLAASIASALPAPAVRARSIEIGPRPVRLFCEYWASAIRSSRAALAWGLMWMPLMRENLHAVPTSPDPVRVSSDGSASVLLLGNYRPTISLVRTLKPLGYRVIVGLGGGEGGAQYSRIVDECSDHPPRDGGGDLFLAALNSLLVNRPDITVVLPVAEEFVRAVAVSRQRLPRARRSEVPPQGVIDATLDKVSLWRLAQSMGVPVAPYGVATTWPELER